MRRVVIVGGSLAGLHAAEELRQRGFDGSITIVSAERHLPYDRPPLSKQILSGEWGEERTPLRERPALEALAVEWELGRRAVALDPTARGVHLDDGRSLPYDGCVLATGAAPRSLPGLPELPGVHLLRTLDDALALRAALDGSPRVVVVGAGFIGSEVAAACRARRLEVTLVEAFPVPLARVLGEAMGRVCAALHRDHGVDLRLGTGVVGVDGDRRVERVRLGDGSVVAADLVVVGVGAMPNTGWLASSGVELHDGVVCDETCATRLPGVVAAGDVARWYNPLFDERMRVEHWTNAVEQGAAAAARLLAGPSAPPFAPVPYFWSDLYETKLQFVGRADPATDEVRVVAGAVDQRKLTACYVRNGRIVGALALNQPQRLMRCKQLIAARAPASRALAA